MITKKTKYALKALAYLAAHTKSIRVGAGGIMIEGGVSGGIDLGAKKKA